jgi:hypothetical protein
MTPGNPLIHAIAAALILTTTGAATAAPVVLQGPSIDVGNTPCAGCAVAVKRATVFGGAETPLTGLPALVIRDGRGRLFVLDRSRRQPPQVYDSSGVFIGLVGGTGKGPGEVTPTSFIEITPGDTIHVHSLGRVSVFAPNLTYVRSFIQRTPDTAPWDLVSLPGGASASTSRQVGTGRDMTPISIRDSKGTLLRTIELSDSEGIQPIRRLAVTRGGASGFLWVSETHQLKTGYRLILMDTVGVVHGTLRREPDGWYAKKAVGRMVFGLDTVPKPVTSIASIREDARRRLLVLVRQAKPGWKAVRPEDQFNGHYEARLEVIDIVNRRLVGSITVSGAPLQILSDDRFATYREDAEGNPWIEVWTVTTTVAPTKR